MHWYKHKAKKICNNMTSKKVVCKLMNKAGFEKTMENVRRNRYIKLLTKEIKRDYLMSDQNYHTTIFFSKNVLAI